METRDYYRILYRCGSQRILKLFTCGSLITTHLEINFSIVKPHNFKHTVFQTVCVIGKNQKSKYDFIKRRVLSLSSMSTSKKVEGNSGPHPYVG